VTVVVESSFDPIVESGLADRVGLKDQFLLFVGPAAYYKELPTGPKVIH
jgi:hypothetical protein